jgi:hypothetical protein
MLLRISSTYTVGIKKSYLTFVKDSNIHHKLVSYILYIYISIYTKRSRLIYKNYLVEELWHKSARDINSMVIIFAGEIIRFYGGSLRKEK